MFIKTFKKTISLFVAMVFILSLVPTGVLAEEAGTELTPVGLPILNPATSRSNSTSEKANHQSLSTTNGSGMSMYINGSSTNTRHGYFQVDFSGYEEILQNDSTMVSFYWTSRNSSSYPITCFYMTAFGDTCDDYNADELTYNSANALGLHTDENGIILYTRSDGEAVSSVKYNVSASNIATMLNTGYDDSLVTFTINPTPSAGKTYLIYANSNNVFHNDRVTISYDSNEIRNDEYVQAVTNKLTWDILSSEDIDSVTSNLNLPKKFYGADVTWSSTNPDVINPSSGEVVMSSDGSKQVTLTANLSYTNALRDTAVAEPITFKVKVSKYLVTLDGTIYTGEKAFPVNDPEGITQTICSGIGGKAMDDYSVSFTDTGTRYINPNINGARYFEMSVLVPENSTGITFSAKAYATSEKTGGSIEYAIRSDGLWSNYTNSKNKKVSLEPNQWHHIAFAAPKILTYDDEGIPATFEKGIRVYVDGQYVDTCTFNEQNIFVETNAETGEVTKYTGFQRMRINAGSNPVYIDNMRWSNLEYSDVKAYNAMPELDSNTLGVDKIGKNITYSNSNLTVSDLKNALSYDEDTDVRVYSSGEITSVALDDNIMVEDGYKVVATTSNGTTLDRTYDYYDIRIVDGKIAFDTPYITMDSETGAIESYVKVYNYTGEKAQYQLYLAIYNEDDSMKEIIPLTLEAELGMATDETLNGTLAKGEYAKFFIWKSDGINPELARVYAER